ncbi:MAG: AAA family ATPase [Hyphomicrobiaceae bacterium]|nr:AAA family ATPase [Hyphomicrobiaceae bacterium]
MEDLVRWLEELGLEQYAQSFADNDVDLEILPALTDSDLKELGLSLGHRRKILLEIARLKEADNTARTDDNDQPKPVGPKEFKELSRRTVTIMFADLVGSTAMSTQLDAEDFSDVNSAYRDACSPCIERFGGRIDRFLGDGILATFGLHKAHEDDPERAIRAGLAIIDAMTQLNASVGKAKGVELAVRVSVATGLVIGGDFIGDGSWEEQDGIVGMAPNLAARLLGIGEPNTLVIDPETKRLVPGSFEYVDLGAHELKGFGDPIRVWQVSGETTIESRLKARGVVFSPLIGRDEEINILLRRWERIKSGKGQVALISGPAGIGKSRVADTIRERVAAELDNSRRYHCYQCSPYHTNTALYPVIKFLSQMAAFDAVDSDEEKYEKLRNLLTGAKGKLDDALAVIADLLGISTAKDHPALDRSPQEKRECALAGLEAWLKALASCQPLLLVFEDLQWMDPTLQVLLRRLVTWASETHVLLIMTLRTDRSDRKELSNLHELAPSRWLDQPHVTQCELRKLGKPAIKQLIEKAAKGHALPPAVIGIVLQKAEGIPLFAEELTKGLLTSQSLPNADGRNVSVHAASGSVGIPGSIQGALMARLDQLGSAKKVVQLGAAIGREFSHSLLAEISDLPEEELSRSLTNLTNSEIIFQRSSAPERTYVFKHALLQDAAYESLPRSIRKTIHCSIAEGLKHRQGTDSGVAEEEIARHYSHGEAIREAIVYWQRASEHAFAQSAQLEAAHHLEQALGLLNKLDDNADRRTLELDVVVKRAAALRAVHGYAWSELEDLYVRAGTLFEQVGETSERFGVEWSRLLFFLVRGDLDRASDVAKGLLAYAERHQDRSFFMDAHLGEGMVKFHWGDFEGARASLQQAADLCRPGEDQPHFLTHGHDPSAFCNSYLAWTLWFLGLPDQARDLIDSAVEQAGAAAQTFSYASALTFAIRIYQFRGDVAAVKPLVEELMTVSRQASYAYYVAQGTIHQGWVLAAEGQVDEGVSQMQTGMDLLRETGTVLGLRGFLVQLAESYELLGLRDKAFEALEEADRGEDGPGTHCWDAEIERLRGELLAAGEGEEQDEAELAFQKGLLIARDQKARALELRIAKSYAQLLQRRSHRKEAIELLNGCLSVFDEGVQTVDVMDATNLLCELNRGSASIES